MSDDPLKLSGLDADLIGQAVVKSKKKPDSDAAIIRAETNAKKEERLARGPPPAPPPPPPAPEPPKVDRSALLDKLGNYRERFPDLKSRNKIGGKSSTEEIEDELHYIEQQLGGGKSGNMVGNCFVAAMAGVEHVTKQYFNPLGLDLNGLTAVSRDNLSEVQPILDELMIKYGVNMAVSAEMRLASTIATMVYTVHAANSGDPATAQAIDKMRKTMNAPKTDL